jgi:hypothetical protein
MLVVDPLMLDSSASQRFLPKSERTCREKDDATSLGFHQMISAEEPSGTWEWFQLEERFHFCCFAFQQPRFISDWPNDERSHVIVFPIAISLNVFVPSSLPADLKWKIIFLFATQQFLYS